MTLIRRYILVSTRTGNTNRWPDMFLSTPTFASTSTLPLMSGRVLIIWCTKSATSLMNSSSGSTPRMDKESGGRLGEATTRLPSTSASDSSGLFFGDEIRSEVICATLMTVRQLHKANIRQGQRWQKKLQKT